MDKSPSSTHTKRSFHGKKLQYQERIVEQPSSAFSTTLMSTYLTAESIRKISPIISSNNRGIMQIKQDMELKPVGKVGMVKRKQFLQKRDISRSHERQQEQQQAYVALYYMSCNSSEWIGKKWRSSP